MSACIAFARLAGHPAGLPDFAYAWLEAPAAARLARRQEVADWADLAAWPAGRLFGPAGEYRWQRHRAEEGVHAVLLLEPAVPMPAGFSAPLDLVRTREAHIVLWGEWVDPQRDREGNPDGGARFYARELPEIQTFPLDREVLPPPAGATPRLTARWYRDAVRQRGEFVRCVGLAMLRDEEPREDLGAGAGAPRRGRGGRP